MDIEAVPPLPEENDDQYSTAIDYQQPTTANRRRKKIAAICVAIFLVVGISIGVSLAVKKPSSSTSKSNSLEGDDLNVNVVTNDDNSEGSSATATTPADNEPTTVTNQEVDWDVSSTPQQEEDEEEQQQDIVLPFEEEDEIDIIYDTGYEQTTTDPDSLQEEMFIVPPEEKVPLVGPVEINVHDGPLSDFIVSDMARISLQTYNGKCTGNNGEWYMELFTDSYPWETSWSMIAKGSGEVIMKGPPVGRNYDRLTRYIGTMCVPEGTYTMRLEDKSIAGDGICCTYGEGYMQVKVNGDTVINQKEGDFRVFEQDIQIVPSVEAQTPINPVTPNPTPNPTPQPVAPTPPVGPAGTLPATIKVRTDNYGGETGYAFESINTGQVLINKPKGSLQRNTLYEDTLFLNEGQRYRLTIKDSINGIESPGYFAVDVDGEEVFYGGRFNTPSGEKSFIVRPGYEPSDMSTNDRLWLNEHNKRRRQFHEDNGVPYGRLVWSNELEDSARAWIPQITSSCSISGNREPGLTPGENIAVRSAGTNINVDESPVAIMQRWVDNKTDLGYPNNQSATQALWAATRFVGCSNAVTDTADGRKCYVSICRYAQAGNCDMGKWKDSNGNVDWEGAATSSRSRCGPTCPEKVVNGETVSVCY